MMILAKDGKWQIMEIIIKAMKITDLVFMTSDGL